MDDHAITSATSKNKRIEKISKPISDLQVQQHSVQYHDITSNNED